MRRSGQIRWIIGRANLSLFRPCRSRRDTQQHRGTIGLGYRNAVKPASSLALLLAAGFCKDKVLKGFETCEFFGAYNILHTWEN